MSFFENITIRRWTTIIVYGFLAAVSIEVLTKVKWAADLFSWLRGTFNSFSAFQQGGFLLILGGLLYLFLLNINAYSKKASFKNLLFYPSITLTVLPAALFLIWLSKSLTFDVMNTFLFKEQIINLLCLIACLLVMNIWHLCSTFKKKNLSESEVKKVEITSESTFEEYKEWFEDDSPISNIHKLSVDLKPYANRITKRIEDFKDKNERFHISLCGGFGSGKSSIIKCVTNKLDSTFIHCNIDTWGTDTKSINAFVLAKVVEDVAQYVDMSAFKSLPKQYIEALKLGNNATKLLAVFSATSTDPLKGLTKLNDVLGAINKKLLITIQDVDRCLEPKKTTEELAALLDKLKELNNISFIVALGYEGAISETIKKVCDYREDIIPLDNHLILLNFINELNQRAADKGFVISHGKANENGDVTSNIRGIEIKLKAHSDKYSNPYDIISSERSFKHICRRIDSIWQKNNLMGEIDLESLCLLIALREELPLVFANVIKNHMTLFNEIRKLENNEKKEYMQNKLGNKAVDEVETKTVTLNECAQYYPSILNFEATRSFLDYLSKCSNDLGQGALYKYSSIKHSNYLKRVMSEFVLNTELKDQEALKLFKNIDETGSFEMLISNFQNEGKSHHWIEAYTRFYRGYFKPTDKNVYEFIYIKMVDFYYKDVVRNNRSPNTLINHADIQQFIILLLEKCLTTENVEKLFELTLNIPTILMANTHNVEPGSCLKLFLSKEQDEELYNIFINKLSVNNEMSKQLYIVDSSNQSLAWIADQFTTKSPKVFEIMKEIILSLLEKNDKENEFYEFDLWFVCYFLDGNSFADKYNKSLDELALLYKLKFLIIEIELLKSSLNQLNIDNVGKYYRHLSDPKGKLEKVLRALENYA